MQAQQTTVDDFSTQWTEYFDNSGYFGSEDLLRDVLVPLYELEDLKGQAIAEIGCGNGRFLSNFAKVARKVYGIEPGDGVENARKHNAEIPNVVVLRRSVYELPCDEVEPLDHVFSIGVVHHLPDPLDAVRRMKQMVKPGGKVTIWVYGKEGNELYLATFGTARKITQRLPHRALHAVSTVLVPPLKGYIRACERAPRLPMSKYMTEVLGRLSFDALRLNIYDQLNPKIAFYWTRDEVRQLLEDAGLENVALHHRHGYSWTATGTRVD